MPFFNADKYIGTAIQSILNQTFEDFELLLIDDGSTDASLTVVSENDDSRIRILQNSKRLGNYAARNMGIRSARGQYVCMMDADDISLRDRLLVQVQFLEKNKAVGAIGALSQIINEDGKIIGAISRPNKYRTLKVHLIMDNQVTQSTLMVRHSLIVKHNLFYNEALLYAGDYEFVLRASRLFRIENLNVVLLQYRSHANQISQEKSKEQIAIANYIRCLQLEYIGIKASENEKQFHTSLMLKNSIQKKDLKDAVAWFNKLLDANLKIKNYNQRELFGLFKTLMMFLMKNAR